MFKIPKGVRVMVLRIPFALIVATTILRVSSGVSLVGGTLITVVAILICIQSSMDIRDRQLHRPTTLLATVVVTVTIVAAVVVRGTWRDLIVAVALTLIVTGVFALLNRLSPRSLGFGDVLLVIPLSLALGYVAPDQIAQWQLVASCSGAIHALVLRLRGGRGSIPFGPHLMGAAWLVLLISV